MCLLIFYYELTEELEEGWLKKNGDKGKEKKKKKEGRRHW